MADAANMNGKVCLITGATSGIGEVAARELARLGATVVVVGRSKEKCVKTVEKIRAETGNSAVDFLVADLSSQADVRRLAEEFKKTYSRLDVLLNNAGAVFTKSQVSLDGFEMTLALNHLNYFLLTNLLLDLLKSSAPARVVNVASDAHRMVKGFNFDDPQGSKRYGGLRIYAQSKLANILFTNELAKRLEGTGVTANSLHPGVVATNFAANNGGIWRVLRKVFDVFSIKVEEGAKTSVFLASSPEVAAVSGKYFDKSAIAQPSPAALDESAGRRLWTLSETWTNR